MLALLGPNGAGKTTLVRIGDAPASHVGVAVIAATTCWATQVALSARSA